MKSSNLYTAIAVLLAVSQSFVRADPNILYSFGPAVQDLVSPRNDDGSVGPTAIDIPFQFFGSVHQSIFVNTNGGISFEIPVGQYTPNAFPLGDGRLIVAAFWADVDTRQNDGNLYYRASTEQALLNQLSHNIRPHFSIASAFQAQWAFVVTWDHVTYYGGHQTTPVNTFQLVLVTDGYFSFVIFNYDEITWTTGTASGGDATTGLGGTPAQVGFNAGDGINYASVPGSRTDDIVNIASTSNIGVTGRYIYRVDNAITGTCGDSASRTVQPRFGSNLGGKPIILTGPCFSATGNLFCSFGGKISPGRYISAGKIECIAPPNPTVSGRVQLLVSNDGNTLLDFAVFTYLSLDPFYHATRENEEHWDDETWEGDRRVSYDQSLLPGVTTVHLDFVSFRDTGEGIEDVATRLQSNVNNNGMINIPNRLSGLTELALSATGALRVTPAGSGSAAIWTEVHSAYWFSQLVIAELAHREQNQEQQPSVIIMLNAGPTQSITVNTLLEYIRRELASQTTRSVLQMLRIAVLVIKTSSPLVCEAYRIGENNNPRDFSDLIAPPCDFETARRDGRFEMDDSCHDGNWLCRFFHNGAHNCIRSRQATAAGHGQQACYDANGNILPYENGGGTVDRVHPGQSKLGHFFWDVAPYLFCCKLTDSCASYKQMRPTQGCENYQPPRPANTRGDPHISTTDGLEYTFNAIGEFTAIKSTLGLVFQGRMIRATINGHLVDATVWSAFAMRTPLSDIVQVENANGRLKIMINGIEEDFSDLPSQTFREVSVVKTETNVTVVFSKTNEEFTATFSVMNGAMFLQIQLTQSYQGNIVGLFGNFDGNPDNDLLTPDGRVLPPTSTDSEIYTALLAWRITEAESLFTYPAGMSYDSYQDLNFTPQFVSMEQALSHPNAEACLGDRACLLDLTFTNDVQFAAATRQASQEGRAARDTFQPEVTCGVPVRPANGQVSYSGVTEGSTAQYSCDPGYYIRGNRDAVCQSNGQWSSYPMCIDAATAEGPKPMTSLITLFTAFIIITFVL